MPKKEPLTKKFWEKVNKTDDPNDCWEWQATKTKGGYGYIAEMKKGKLTRYRAHRLSYCFHHGLKYNQIPVFLFCCHLCDNRPCVNPYHLVLGTHKFNIEDALRKGRFTSKRTFCQRGHRLSGNNIIFKSNGNRNCRACQNAAKRRYNHRRKKKLLEKQKMVGFGDKKAQ